MQYHVQNKDIQKVDSSNRYHAMIHRALFGIEHSLAFCEPNHFIYYNSNYIYIITYIYIYIYIYIYSILT